MAGPSFVMVPRKLILAIVASYAAVFILVLASFQYTNYISRQMCGIITTQADAYQKEPPTSNTGKLLASEFKKVRAKYHCD